MAKLSEQQLQRLWIKAGGDAKVAPMMAKIAVRESGGDRGAQNLTYPDHSIGLWQINQLAHKGRYGDDAKLKTPLANAKAAVAVYKLQGPKAWSTYNPAIDKKYIGAAAAQPSRPNNTSVMSPQPSGGMDMNKQIALSLLGFGNVGGDSYGDPLTMALTQALQQKQTATPSPRSTQAQPRPAGHVKAGGSTTFDGKPVASWIAPILAKARKTGLWKGGVNSGVRSKSEQLAAAKRYGLQHYPNGPLASNHVEGHPGAVDVSDPEGLKRALRALHSTKLKSSMPEDPVHFSGTGY